MTTAKIHTAACRLAVLSLVLCLGFYGRQRPRTVDAAATHNIAYIFDFGGGVNDTGFEGSSIFFNALTGGAIGFGSGGNYNGAQITNVPVSTVDSGGSAALAGFDTLLLYQVCDIINHPNTMTAVNNFLSAGGNVMIFDADRCGPGLSAAGQADYSGFMFPFKTSSPGPEGDSGPYTKVIPSTLTTGLSAGQQSGDAVGDANTFTTYDGAWCAAIIALNRLGNNGIVEAYARTAGGGLVIYEGEDVWATLSPTAHLKQVYDNMQAQMWNPDGLPDTGGSCPLPGSGISLAPKTATNPAGTPHTLTATVVDVTGNPQAGITVSFAVKNGPNAGKTGTGTTDGSGTTTFTYTGTGGAGTDTIVASFTDHDGNVHTSNDATKTWIQRPTSTAVSCVPSTVVLGASTTCTATVTDTGSGTAVAPTGSVTFGSDQPGSFSGNLCTLVTGSGASSICSVGYSPAAAGLAVISADYGGDTLHTASIALTTLTAIRPTALTYTGATIGEYSDAVTLSATLTDPSTSPPSPIAGKTVAFTLGTQGCSNATDSSGHASCALVLTQTPGSYTVMAAFAGDGTYQSAKASAAFSLTREETSLTYTGDTLIANGGTAHLAAVLVDPASATEGEPTATPITARSVTFTLGSGSTAQTCAATTDAVGVASCAIGPVGQPLGPDTITAVFAGDRNYQPATATAPVLIFAYATPLGASFVIGDQNAAVNTMVTFWGAQWAKDNSLSGGSAVVSFKGFAANPGSNPPACGGTWTTGPGNSANPPDSVPAYMAVVVSSHVDESGSTISGDIKQIVIVKSDSGYAGNPGHAGTGTVLAVLCKV